MINVKNELFYCWKDFHEKAKSDKDFIIELEDDLL